MKPFAPAFCSFVLTSLLLPGAAVAQSACDGTAPTTLCPDASGKCVVTSGAEGWDYTLGDGKCGANVGSSCVCTLRAAINELNQHQKLNPSDTRTFTIDLSGVPGNVVTLTYQASSTRNDDFTGDLDVQTNIDIVGQAARSEITAVWYNGGDNVTPDRIFHVVPLQPFYDSDKHVVVTYPVPTLTLDHINVVGGGANKKYDANQVVIDNGDGGGIWVDLTPAQPTGFFASAPPCAYTPIAAALVMNDSSVSACTAVEGGGGISSSGKVTLTNSEVGEIQGIAAGNKALTACGGIELAQGSNGKACLGHAACLDLPASDPLACPTCQDSQGHTVCMGPVPAAVITDSNITNNQAVTFGGGLCDLVLKPQVTPGAVALTVTHSHIDRNSVFASAVNVLSGGGGVLLFGVNDTSHFTDSTISSNQCSGGIPGGGVKAFFSTVNLFGVTVADNQLFGTAAATLAYVYVGGAGIALEAAAATIDRSAAGPSIISGNDDSLDYANAAGNPGKNWKKSIYSGGGIVFFPTLFPGLAFPSATFPSVVPTLNVAHTSIHGNVTRGNGGGVFLAQSAMLASGLQRSPTPQPLSAIFADVTIDSNVALDQASSQPTGDGSGIYLENQTPWDSDFNSNGNPGGTGFGASLLLESSTISNNGCALVSRGQGKTVASANGGVLIGCGNAGATVYAHSGGGIGQLGGAVRAVNTTITGNQVKDFGGGWDIEYASNAYLYNTTVVANTSAYVLLALTNALQSLPTGGGGGIYVSNFPAAKTSSGSTYNPIVLSKNSLITDNISNDGKSSDCLGSGFPAGSGLVSGGYNLIEQDGCSALDAASTVITQLDPTDVIGVSGQVGALADNGGVSPFAPIAPANTLTLLPQPGSAAIDKIPLANCTWTDFAGTTQVVNADERHAPRPTAGAFLCDIGAVEIAESDLTVTKTASAKVVALGHDVTFTITVANAGPNDATGVIVTDPLVSTLTFKSASAGCSLSGATVICAVGTVSAGSSISISITATVNQTAANGAVISNSATASGDNPDPKPSDNTGTTTVTVGDLADLGIVKSGPSHAALGQQIVYTLTVSNAGPAMATGVSVSDDLPPGTAFVSASGDGSCSGAGSTVTCSAPSLAAGSSIAFAVTVKVTAAGVITNIATVTSATSDPNLANNTSQSVQTNVSAASPLAAELFSGGGILRGCHAGGASSGAWLFVVVAFVLRRRRRA